MALKLKITKEDYEQLDESVQGLYTEADGEYSLDVEGLEDTGALKRAKDHEKAQRKKVQDDLQAARDRLKELEEESEKAKADGHRKAGDIDAITKSYDAKIEKIKSEYEAKLNESSTIVQRTFLDSAVSKLASELSGENAHLIEPHIRGRLKADITDGEVKIHVLDEKGQVSADTLEDLKSSIFTNDRFAPIVVGSKASGSGGSNGGSGSPQKKKLSEMSGLEEVQFAKDNPEEYEKMVNGG